MWVYQPVFPLGISRIDPSRYAPRWLAFLPSRDDHAYDFPMRLVALAVMLGIHAQPVVIDTDKAYLDIVGQIRHVIHFREKLDGVT
jgi:hypothetical protein